MWDPVDGGSVTHWHETRSGGRRRPHVENNGTIIRVIQGKHCFQCIVYCPGIGKIQTQGNPGCCTEITSYAVSSSTNEGRAYIPGDLKLDIQKSKSDF